MSKDEKIYDDFNLEFSLKEKSRKELRDKTINKFLSEKGGYWKDGKKHVTRYKYFVEKLKDSRQVFLLRPTFLNKGIDFQVWVEKMDWMEDKRPSHKDILNDLKLKKFENPIDFKILMQLIDRIWNCEDPDECLKKINLKFKDGFSVELLLKVLKWLFIEQDITYWNYDGRTMLKMTIDKNFGD